MPWATAHGRQARLSEGDRQLVAPGAVYTARHCLAGGGACGIASAPSEAHYEAMLNVVRYVGSTAGQGLTYGGSDKPLGFWCDANFAACQDTRRSTTGWVVVMYGGAVSWASKKQPTAAASTMEAEYQACGAAAREGLSLGKAFGELALLSPYYTWAGQW
jgi:hypothetical protein